MFGFGRLAGCFGFNGPARLFESVLDRLPNSGRKKSNVKDKEKYPNSLTCPCYKHCSPMPHYRPGRPGTESGQAPSQQPTTLLAIERDELAFYYIHVNPSKLWLEKHLRSKAN